MSIKIVIDSACDLEKKLSENIKIQIAPLLIDLDNKTYVDYNLDMGEFLGHMKKMTSFKTACPSVQNYEELYDGEEDVLVITISNKLSASYQSAIIAKNQYFENHGNSKKIHVFDSKTASAGQVAVLVKTIECCESGMAFDDIVEKIENSIKSNITLFMLQSLNNLSKAGRVNALIAKTTSVLNIRCVMTADQDGKINLVQKVIGENKCIKNLANTIEKLSSGFKDRTLCISHCEGIDKVNALLKELSEIMDVKIFRNVLIQKTNGLSSIYSDFGGIVIGF